MVLEGPLAGGHLGFTPEEARQAQAGSPRSLVDLLEEVLEALAPFREKYGRDIPVFAAGGVKDGREMARCMAAGAVGAQFATRFIATEECDASTAYKQILIGARKEDAVIVESPVGLPGRALAAFSAVLFFLSRAWTAGQDMIETRCDLYEAVKDALLMNGFHIPYPQRQVTVEKGV